MEITFNRLPIEYFLIDNFVSDKHINQFLDECENEIVNSKDQDKSACNNDGTILRNGQSVFLNRKYKFNAEESSILTNLKTYLYQNKFLTYISDTDTHFQYWQLCNNDWTMISRYGNGDYYKPHKDNSLFTSLLWLNREPKEFSGGNLSFPSHNHTIEYKNNRCIIFPSVTTHEVSEVFMDTKSANGRFCITVFSIIDF